jgi:hypothetical protein
METGVNKDGGRDKDKDNSKEIGVLVTILVIINRDRIITKEEAAGEEEAAVTIVTTGNKPL